MIYKSGLELARDGRQGIYFSANDYCAAGNVNCQKMFNEAFAKIAKLEEKLACAACSVGSSTTDPAEYKKALESIGLCD